MDNLPDMGQRKMIKTSGNLFDQDIDTFLKAYEKDGFAEFKASMLDPTAMGRILPKGFIRIILALSLVEDPVDIIKNVSDAMRDRLHHVFHLFQEHFRPMFEDDPELRNRMYDAFKMQTEDSDAGEEGLTGKLLQVGLLLNKLKRAISNAQSPEAMIDQNDMKFLKQLTPKRDDNIQNRVSRLKATPYFHGLPPTMIPMSRIKMANGNKKTLLITDGDWDDLLFMAAGLCEIVAKSMSKTAIIREQVMVPQQVCTKVEKHLREISIAIGTIHQVGPTFGITPSEHPDTN